MKEEEEKTIRREGIELRLPTDSRWIKLVPGASYLVVLPEGISHDNIRQELRIIGHALSAIPEALRPVVMFVVGADVYQPKPLNEVV